MRSLQAFCVSEKVSGGELYILELLAAMERLGWSCSIVTGNNTALMKRATEYGIRSSQIRLGPKLGKKTFFRTICTWPIQLVRLRRHLKRSEFPIVLMQYKLEQLLSAFLPPKGVTVILEHGPVPDLITRIPPVRMLYVRALRRADLVLAASGPAKTSLRTLGVDSRLLLAGNDPRRVMSATDLRTEHRSVLEDYVGAGILGVYAGRIVANKGVFDAVRLVSGLSGVGLVLFGDGPDADLLRERVADLPNVFYAGPVPDPLPYIAAADFGILLTRDPGEGRPLFGIECLSVGTPLVAVGGSAAIDGLVAEFGPDNVRLIDPTSSAGLASSIRKTHARNFYDRSWDDAAADFKRYIASIERQ